MVITSFSYQSCFKIISSTKHTVRIFQLTIQTLGTPEKYYNTQDSPTYA